MCSCEKQLSQAATGTSYKVSPVETYPQQDPPLVMHKAIYFKYSSVHMSILGFPDGLAVKNPPAMQETQVQSLGWEDALEEEMTTHSSILA